MVRSLPMRSLCVFSLLLIGTVAWADLPGNRTRPRPQPQPPMQEVKLQSRVEINGQAKLEGEDANAVAKIVIPRKLLQQLLQQPGAAPAAAPVKSEAPPYGTVIAGLCLALAVVAAGWGWKRSAVRNGAVISSIVLAGLGVATSGFADIPPFKTDRPKPLVDQNPQNQPTVILVSDQADGPVRMFLKPAPGFPPAP